MTFIVKENKLSLLGQDGFVESTNNVIQTILLSYPGTCEGFFLYL
jgi:hypothetical protein